MKDEIIKIIGFMMEPERAELKAQQIILLFNQRIVNAMKDPKNRDLTELINDIWIPLQ